MLKKLSLLPLFTLLPASFYYAQTTVYAYVKDQEGKIIERAEVDLASSSNDVVADKIGYFQLVDLMPGQYMITISKPNYESKTVPFEVLEGEKRKDLGVISLAYSTGSDAGVIVIDDSVNDSGEGGSMQPTVGLLNSGRDAFQNAAAFELGAYWFRPRGIDNRFEDVLFNGVPMSKNDDGRIDFSNWGGLNDITRYPFENVDNLTPSEYGFGNLGGLVYYNTRASSFRKQTSLAYSLTNRSYLHRAMATYSSGLTKDGWAITLSASRRWGDKAIIDGVYQDSYGFFAAIEKQFSDRHSINLSAFGSPTYRATNSPNTQEVYDLMGKDYNSFWGWQDGEQRNSRIRKTFEPVFMLTDYLKLGKTSNWINTISYQVGSDARSRLDWFHGSDPNPTYYRKLPSYMFQSEYDALAAATPGTQDYEDALAAVNSQVEWWKQNTNTQIDWTALYNSNMLNKDVNGMDNGAIYSLVEDVTKDKTFNWSSHFDTKLQDNWKLNINFNYQNLNSDNFRRVKDLLGANYAWNLNPFLNDEQYNVDDSNVKVKEGDRTQYSYILNKNSYALNVSTEVDFAKFNIVGSVFASYSESYRDGQYRHSRYLDNSKGKSAVYSALDAGIKAKLTYKINGKNFIVYNGALFSAAPTLNEIFINPRVNDFVTPGVRNQIINSNELSFIHRGQILKLRLSGYLTNIYNATEISRYYVDLAAPQGTTYNTLVTEALSGANKRYMGLELGADIKVTPTFNIIAAAALGEYKYTNNPNVVAYDDINQFRGEDFWLSKAQIKDYKVAGTPQSAYSLGVKYNSPKYWWIGASANYLMDNYLDFSALNKTTRLYTDFNYEVDPRATPEEIQRLTAQRKLDNEFMLNANAGKSFQIGKYRLGISVSVNNILNNRNYITGGFEQGRNINFDDAYNDANRIYPHFAPKLWYDKGRTYFANVYLRF